MNRILRVRSLIPQARANLSTSVKRFDNAKVRRNQERFQHADGKPVHLKGGPMDMPLYYCAFAFVGGSCVYALYGLSQLILKK
ncbi:cytochrome c oxidase subunit 7A2, mitochondrial-like isoform X2 [Anneissia japonica]|uniref:cytochrome c oxidase subunit 7A2, mitochondrial-like isoform X2 n=1 Tax=Anneissia japonica TaxID=1529436 RepID=UPI001425A22A|nr:cytochrome c oxidase subunit 7A2, mitochondrial-like isoform X2 [Anneissia japonica]